MKRIASVLLKILSLRYTIEIKGFSDFNEKNNYLILPNHIAYIDPIILRCIIRQKIKISPVTSTMFTENPRTKQILKWIDAIPMQEIHSSEKKEKEEIKDALKSINTNLKQGNSILLYPSGQLAGQGEEYIGGKKSAYLAVQNIEKPTKIILVRTRGLWGSMRSNAEHPSGPNLGKGILRGIRYLIANGIFFIPRRKVTIEFKEATNMLQKASKEKLEIFNTKLGNFYNQKGEEKLNYLQHYFYYNDMKNKQLPNPIRNSIQSMQANNTFLEKDFDPKIFDFVKNAITSIKKEKLNLHRDDNLYLDLYLDSLDMAELKNLIILEYPNASDIPLKELKTVGDLVAMASRAFQNQSENLPPCDRGTIKKEKIILKKNQNILQLFRGQRKKKRKENQSYDVIFGMQTRNDIVLKALVMSDYLKKIKGERLGIMLPAIGSVNILLIATYLAKKIPVMMNRTLSEKAFDHCVNFSKTEKILTSKAFFNKIDIPRLKNYNFIFLEDLLKDIPLHRKLKALLKSRFFPIPKKLDATAVVLYTSGSESLPKAVRLSHQNIISDIQGCLDLLDTLASDEKFLCYLPPFHSFGFTINTVAPLITGTKTISTPDPNDALTIRKLIRHTQPTILATTPTFRKNILSISNKEDLKSLCHIISGGEKCPDQIFEDTKKMTPHAHILEGYGITECSPVVSVNPPKKTKKNSVGISIPGGKIQILDLETQKQLPKGKEGMIYYSGQNVFDGYEDRTLEEPFLHQNGEKRYKTGDLGYLDKDNYLFITGRKKRFLKLGGEMISLPFLEELIEKKWGNPDEIRLALEGTETDHDIKIVLFTVDMKVSVEEVNHYLREQGVNNLIRIDEVKKIEKIPLLGTGKIDYKELKALL